METKERMTPEQEVQEMAAYTAHKSKIKKLEECLALARELNIVNQIPLYESEIKTTTKRWKIDHQNPYQEVTKEQAADAMCEPYQACDKHSQKDCAHCRLRRAPTHRDYKFKLWADAVVMPSPRNGLTQTQNEGLGQALLAAQLGQQQTYQQQAMQSQNYQQLAAMQNMYLNGDRWTYAQLSGSVAVMTSGRTVGPAMLPLPALIRLKEAKEREIFDSYEVWRPVTKEEYEQLTDPWLVGIVNDEKARYFRLCDWR